MDAEMAEKAIWTKAIPEARDRVQSQWLVVVVGSSLVVLSGVTLVLAYGRVIRFPAFVLSVVSISVGFAVVVWMLRAATAAAAACGGMICLLLTFWTGSFDGSVGRTALTPLAALFVLTFLSTRAGRQRKTKAGLAEKRRGRSASQVIANLSVAALCVTPLTYAVMERVVAPCCVSGIADSWINWAMKVMSLAVLIEATADTVSSEVGQAFGGLPVMVLGFRRVDPGTDGAVTLLGTAAGVFGGVIVAAVGMWALSLSSIATAIAFVAGICGLFFDSLLGATIERRGWLGNDMVNFTSTAFAAALAASLYRMIAFTR
jgi:uncharacterized protein (TIGR00297 family)